ncbi:hypothetical protein QGN29_06240 [Temperatibacter marinus]|uniref:Uridine kinase n=1 Tax=Temperatibacter marinus TaxID=1456591 RepID=A0AA52EK29_9PROT|nr:hypothetical protein [Temperatibacter marinus]WND03972.1 hypothetical protein QGN29_06240 [Temperatibacter marinus]
MIDRNTILQNQSAPYVIGVNGLDCAGKTTYALKLQQILIETGKSVNLLHIDDFNNLAQQKIVYDAYAKGAFSESLFEAYYDNSIHYNKVADALEASKDCFTITIIEGVFLYKQSLVDLIDYKIFLRVDQTLARERYADRKIAVDDSRPLTVFEDIWVRAYDRYCAEYQPETLADFIDVS